MGYSNFLVNKFGPQPSSYSKYGKPWLFAQGLVFSSVGFIVHLMLIPVFISLGSNQLFWFNCLFSLPVFLFAFWCTIKGWYPLNNYLGTIEVVAHAIFASYFIGWSSGFYFYVITSMVYVWLMPGLKFIAKLSTFTIILSGLNIAYLISPEWHLSQTHLSDPFKSGMFIFNLCSAAFILGFFIFELSNQLESAEFKLKREKTLVQEQHKEIMDSISYARRIQSAILPPDSLVKEYLKNSFIFYKPKDIVSGDFYWMESVGNSVIFAAADCTGHGVPGAMLSMLCNNALNRSVREYGLNDPGQILDKTRSIIIEDFEKSEEQVKDGMDISLCSLSELKLEFAGAYNNMWVVRKGEVIEIKADRQPIGNYGNPIPFTTQSFDLQKGDILYIFSDGYVDQFGGKNGKKLKSKKFRNIVLGVTDKPMAEQKELLDDALKKWRGDLEQIDDVCMIGVRV